VFGFAFEGTATFAAAFSFSTGATSICICRVVVSSLSHNALPTGGSEDVLSLPELQ
jgi:hypothetical protein